MNNSYIVVREKGTDKETRRVNVTGCTEAARMQVTKTLLRDIDASSFYLDYVTEKIDGR